MNVEAEFPVPKFTDILYTCSYSNVTRTKAHESSRYMMNSATRTVIKDQSSNLIKQNIQNIRYHSAKYFTLTIQAKQIQPA